MLSELKPHISCIDKSFKESQVRNYKLAMQLSLYGLDFVVYNPEKNKFIAFENYRFPDETKIEEIPLMFDKVMNHREWFAFPFGKVFLLYQNQLNTFIPTPLFEEKEKNLYLGFNQPFSENHRILYDNLKTTEAVNAYYFPNPVAEKVKDFWPNVQIRHFVSGFVESLAINFKNKTDNKDLFLNLHEEFFDLVYFRDNKLYFTNTFAFRTKEDFIYFLLATIEQLLLNPEEVQLIIMGNTDKSTPEYDMIYQYIRNSRFVDRNENYLYSFVLDNVLHYRYYVLYNVLQCES